MKDKHSFYMRLAQVVSEQSYAVRNKVGCILVKDTNIISFGYNGTPYGFDNTCETVTKDEPIRLVTLPEVIHAESNAITKCAMYGISSVGSTLYTTLAPCISCGKLILQAGIKEVFYMEYYNMEGEFFLKNAGIESLPIFL